MKQYTLRNFHGVLQTFRIRHLIFYKNTSLKNFTEFTEKHLRWSSQFNNSTLKRTTLLFSSKCCYLGDEITLSGKTTHGYLVHTHGSVLFYIAIIFYRSRGIKSSNDIFEVSKEHTPDKPKLNRVRFPSVHHPVFNRLLKNSKLLDCVEDLVCFYLIRANKFVPTDWCSAKQFL